MNGFIVTTIVTVVQTVVRMTTKANREAQTFASTKPKPLTKSHKNLYSDKVVHPYPMQNFIKIRYVVSC